MRGVASFTDAWIETEINDINEHVNLSHLLQMRGLKQQGGALKPSGLGSHLLQMRGLKQTDENGKRIPFCRIFYRCVD